MCDSRQPLNGADSEHDPFCFPKGEAPRYSPAYHAEHAEVEEESEEAE